MTSGIVIRKCQTLEEFHRCVALQREVWSEADLEIEPVTAFVVAAHTGGQVLGAFDGERLAGLRWRSWGCATACRICIRT